MSIAATIRDAIVADFNAAGTAYFGVAHPFTATAKWFEQISNTDETLRVAVIPDQQRTTRTTRGYLATDVDILVHMQRKLSIGSQESGQTDQLFDVLEKLERYYYTQAARVAGVATLVESQVQLPMRKHLKDGGRWYGYARLTFRVIDL